MKLHQTDRKWWSPVVSSNYDNIVPASVSFDGGITKVAADPTAPVAIRPAWLVAGPAATDNPAGTVVIAATINPRCYFVEAPEEFYFTAPLLQITS